jgi:TctA family transporter
VGGETAPFIAWGHAKQFSKHPEQFGKGCVEGVIAPESANNAKEGGSLVPTVAFGVPGSASMAILLGGFLILGLEPGPLILKYHIDIVWSLVGVLIFANVIGALVCLFFAGQLSRISFIRGHLLAPLVLSLCVIGTFSVHSDLIDIVWMFMFGALGYAMKTFGYPRPATLLGFVLGSIAEVYFHISVRAYGPFFFTEPIALVLIFLLFASVGFEFYNRYRKKRRATT